MFQINLEPDMLALFDPRGYKVTEVFSGQSMGSFVNNTSIKVEVLPSDIFFGRADVKTTTLYWKPFRKFN